MGTHVMIKSPIKPSMPLQVRTSKTSNIDQDALAMDTQEMKYDGFEEDEEDLFEKCYTLREEQSKSSSQCDHSRQNTLNRKQPFFVVNKKTFLKFHIDETGKNYMTLPILSNTTALDAIQKISARRKLPFSTHCKLYQDNEEIADDASLLLLMQTSSSPIIVRFIANNKSENEAMENYLVSPPNSASKNELNGIANHHFSIRQSDDNDVPRDAVLKNIENKLKSLQTKTFYVMKINKYNKHQKRVLKLTEYGIENIKPAQSSMFSSTEAKCTSFHLWENISNSYLEDSKTIKIYYKDYKDGDRRYESKEANDINESIQQRLKIIKEQTTNADRKEISIQFQKKLMLEQITNNKLFEMNDHVRLTRNRSGYIVYRGFVHFAPGEHFGIALDADNGDHDGLYDGIRYFKTDKRRAIIVPKTQIIRKIMTTTQKAKKKKSSTCEKMAISDPFAHEFKSIEDIIYKEIKALILSNNTLEGRYRNNFANKFHKYAKDENLLTLIRDFMDAVKQKIDERHSERFKERILDSWHGNDEMKNEEDDKKEMSEQEKAFEMVKLGETMNNLIESAMEQTILQLKIKEIYKICMDVTHSQLSTLIQKLYKLRGKQQGFFGIKKELQSSTNWNRAVYELSLLRDCTLPSEKIKALVNCAHAIYVSHSRRQRDKIKKDDSYYITGDDFLPIVIYVIVQASKIKPCITDADLIFMEGLVDSTINRSEPGYYLAVFHAALQWIRCFN